MGDGGRAEALKHFIEVGPAVKEIFELFDQLRAAAGDALVSKELAEYVETLVRRARHGASHYAQLVREAELLRQQLDTM